MSDLGILLLVLIVLIVLIWIIFRTPETSNTQIVLPETSNTQIVPPETSNTQIVLPENPPKPHTVCYCRGDHCKKFTDEQCLLYGIKPGDISY